MKIVPSTSEYQVKIKTKPLRNMFALAAMASVLSFVLIIVQFRPLRPLSYYGTVRELYNQDMVRFFFDTLESNIVSQLWVITMVVTTVGAIVLHFVEKPKMGAETYNNGIGLNNGSWWKNDKIH